MATIRILPISHPFPSPLTPQSKPTTTRLLPPPPRAVEPNQTDTPSDSTDDVQPSSATSTDFDSRLSQVRLKYRSGTGKKAEQRRAKSKNKPSSTSSSGKNTTMMLPPVALKEPASGGAKVELGFTRYSERLNGAVAGLGLAALVLVELGSGKGLFKYHAGPTMLIQIYTVSALAAVFVKFERERISVWPEKAPVPTTETTTTSDAVGE